MLCFLLLISCKRCNFYNIPANVEQGGRTIALAVHPTNKDVVWAATESGGVFKTINAGQTWTHADNLQEFSCNDIDVAPSNPNLVIVGTGADTRVRNGGGIWISQNGGDTWEQPITALPRDASGVPARFSAYGISFMPGTNRIYVGSDSGVVVSEDLGVNWRYINPEPSRAKKAIFSVLALNSRKVLLYGENGVWISDDGLTGWRHDRTGMTNGWNIADAFAVSPINNNHIFFTNSWENLFYSIDGGETWRTISIDFRAYDASRQPYVKAVRSLSGRTDEVDLYCSNKSYVGRKTIRWTGSDFDFSGSWNLFNFAHWDPSDLVFTEGNVPYMAANDGGVEKSTDRGASWSVISKPSNFFNALQVFNVHGSFYNGPSPRVDLYFGTQDNSFWGSDNDGGTWPYRTGQEGFQIQGPNSFTNTTDSSISYFNIGGCPSCRSKPHYVEPADITEPTPYRTSIPVYVRGKTYAVLARLTETTTLSYVFISNDEGRTWTQTNVSINRDIVGFPVVSGVPSNLSFIVPFKASGGFDVTGIFNLKKIDNLFDGIPNNETNNTIPFPLNCNLGIVPTMWPWYPCFGVDPNDPQFMIIPDAQNKTIWKTNDGGTNWTADGNLMHLVTDNGTLLFHMQFAAPQVRSIAFDPQNSNHIAIGTHQAGVIYSRDKGTTWQKLPKSEQIPFITSFFFRDDTTAIASTYGRGLVKIYIRDEPVRDIAMQSTNPKINRQAKGVQQDKPQSIDSTAPTLYVKNIIPGSAVTNIHSGQKTKLTGSNWSQDFPLSISLNGKEIEQKIKVDNSGKFIWDIPIMSEPKLLTLVVKQLDKNKKIKQVSMILKVSISDAGKEKNTKDD